MDLAVDGDETGERTLARPRVTFGTLMISTYEPIEDPCTPGGIQRTYVLDALSGAGALPYCPNCGTVDIGIGAPFSPPVAIYQPSPPDPEASPFPGYDDPDDPDGSDFPTAPDAGDDVRQSWCSVFGIPPLFVGDEMMQLGTICEGRQSWREIK